MSAYVTLADTRRLPLGQGKLIMGRNASNDICIPEDSVSGVHARMRQTDKGWVIEDLNSTNGTFVDKVRLKAGIEYLLSDGQTIHLGDYGMRFHATGWDEARTRAAAATPGMPAAPPMPPPPAPGPAPSPPTTRVVSGQPALVTPPPGAFPPPVAVPAPAKPPTPPRHRPGTSAPIPPAVQATAPDPDPAPRRAAPRAKTNPSMQGIVGVYGFLEARTLKSPAKYPIRQEVTVAGTTADDDIRLGEAIHSPVRFEIRIEGAAARVRNLAPDSPMRVGGVPVREGMLENGTRIEFPDVSYLFIRVPYKPPPAAEEAPREAPAPPPPTSDDHAARPRTMLAAVAAGAMLCLLVGGWLVLRAPGRGPMPDAVAAIRAGDQAALVAIRARAGNGPAGERQVIEAALALLEAKALPPKAGAAPDAPAEWDAALESLRAEWKRREQEADAVFLRSMVAVETWRTNGDRAAAEQAVVALHQFAGQLRGSFPGLAGVAEGRANQYAEILKQPDSAATP